jgi:glyoxylate reductase
MKPKCLVTRRLLPEAVAYLGEHVEFETATESGDLPEKTLVEKVSDKEGLLCLLVDQIGAKVMDAAPRLKIIANCAVGFNNIDVEAAKERGIVVTNTPGVLTEATADLTWALILAVARRIPQSDRFLREGRFKGWAIDLCLGKDIAGKRLGIIGMGRIGRAVAARARAFGTETVYADPQSLSPEDERVLSARAVGLDDLLRTSDIVSVHASLTPESRHLLSRERLSLMKKEAILVNVARGPIVDESALAEALERGNLWGAGLDVYEREPAVEAKLLSLENAVLLPHVGSATYGTRLRMCLMAARNLVQGLRGEKPDNPVHWPPVAPPRERS